MSVDSFGAKNTEENNKNISLKINIFYIIFIELLAGVHLYLIFTRYYTSILTVSLVFVFLFTFLLMIILNIINNKLYDEKKLDVFKFTTFFLIIGMIFSPSLIGFNSTIDSLIRPNDPFNPICINEVGVDSKGNKIFDCDKAEIAFYGDPCKGTCSGHIEGYNYAFDKQLKDVDSCTLGKSKSFISGCVSGVKYSKWQGKI